MRITPHPQALQETEHERTERTARRTPKVDDQPLLRDMSDGECCSFIELHTLQHSPSSIMANTNDPNLPHIVPTQQPLEGLQRTCTGEAKTRPSAQGSQACPRELHLEMVHGSPDEPGVGGSSHARLSFSSDHEGRPAASNGMLHSVRACAASQHRIHVCTGQLQTGES